MGDGVGDAVRQLGGEPVAGQVHQHRDPPPDGLGDLERADELALLQSDDRGDESRQRRRLELEDEVARQVLEHVARRPPRVRVHARRAQVEGVGDLCADTGDVEDADPVRVRRQQTDEPGLHAAPFDGHHRLSIAAEDRRHVIGAGDRDVAAGLHRARGAGPLVVARQAELAALDQGQAAVCRHVVVGGPEEHELPCRQPREDRRDLGQGLHPPAHRREVVDDTLDVGDRTADLALDRGGRRVVGAVDLDLGPRLEPAGDLGGVRRDVDEAVTLVPYGPQHRVHEQVHAEPAPLEHEPHRVDEERHVVGDDEHDGVRGVPAVALAVGRHHPGHARPGRRVRPSARWANATA